MYKGEKEIFALRTTKYLYLMSNRLRKIWDSSFRYKKPPPPPEKKTQQSIEALHNFKTLYKNENTK